MCQKPGQKPGRKPGRKGDKVSDAVEVVAHAVSDIEAEFESDVQKAGDMAVQITHATDMGTDINKAAHVLIDVVDDKKKDSVSIAGLFRYADGQDHVLLAVAAVAVAISGANQPLQLIVFGNLLDSFNDETAGSVKDNILFLAGMYALLGLQQMVTLSLQSACLAKVAARQVARVREYYFKALTRKPISFIDSQGGGALATSVIDSTAIMQAGMGDDLAKLGQQLLAFIVGLAVALVYSCAPPSRRQRAQPPVSLTPRFAWRGPLATPLSPLCKGAARRDPRPNRRGPSRPVRTASVAGGVSPSSPLSPCLSSARSWASRTRRTRNARPTPPPCSPRRRPSLSR